MLSKLFLLVVGVAVCAALSASSLGSLAGGGGGEEAHAVITELKSDVRHDGFDYSLETSNHIQEQRSGDEHGNLKGDFSWVSHEGVPFKVSYVADEHGYQPKYVLETKP